MMCFLFTFSGGTSAPRKSLGLVAGHILMVVVKVSARCSYYLETQATFIELSKYTIFNLRLQGRY